MVQQPTGLVMKPRLPGLRTVLAVAAAVFCWRPRLRELRLYYTPAELRKPSNFLIRYSITKVGITSTATCNFVTLFYNLYRQKMFRRLPI